MSPERKSGNSDRFSRLHENTVRDLGKQPALDIEIFRKKFKDGGLEASDAHFIGIRLIHTANNDGLTDSINLGLAYLSQAIELEPGNPRYKWTLRHEKRTHRVIAVQRYGEVSKEEALHDETLIRVAGNSRKRKKDDSPPPYDIYDFEHVLVESLTRDEDEFLEKQSERARKKIQEKDPILRLSPSVVASCARKEGFRQRGVKGAPGSTESQIARLMGSSFHYNIERVIKRQNPDTVATEVQTHFGEEADIKGYIDIFYLIRQIHEYLVVDFKTTSSRRFREIKRDGVPEHIRKNKRYYAPREEDVRQVLLYMIDKRDEGYDTKAAILLYVDSDSKRRKQSLILWDDYKSQAEELQKEVKKAKEAIKNGQLPEPRLGEYCKYCPWLKDCEPGQRHMSNERIPIRKKPMSPQARAFALKGREESIRRQTELGRLQPTLLGGTIFEVPKPS